MIIKKSWSIDNSKLTALYNPILDFRLIFLNKKIIHHSLGLSNRNLDLTLNNCGYNMIFCEDNIVKLLDKNNQAVLSKEKCKTPFYFYVFFILNLIVPIFTFESPSHWYGFFLITLIEKCILTKSAVNNKLKFILCLLLSGLLYFLFIKSFIPLIH